MTISKEKDMLVFLLIVLGIVLGAILIGISVLLIYLNIRNKYYNFVSQNSICIEKLKEINSRYVFNISKSFDQSHTYDNENFFNNISCTDYLIYQLQFIKYDVLKQIKAINANAQRYEKYLNEVNKITEYGNYKCQPKKLRIKKLIKIEKKLFENTKLLPQTIFSLKVVLFIANINGRIYDNKYQSYTEEQITYLIKRINNKNGKFYNDRHIWDAICRVERGKVSNKMRFSIYARDGYRCRICGARQGKIVQLEIDHIIPIAKGGKSTYDNLQTLCHNCNVQKGDNI